MKHVPVALVALIAITIAVAAWVRLPYGVDFTDESFYVALPYSFVLGHKPFADEHTLQQTAGLIVTPIVKAYVAARGNDGLVLFLRRLWLALALLTSAFVFFFARRFGPPEAAIAAAALPVAVVVASIPNLSYNTLGMLLLTIALSASGLSMRTECRVPWIIAAVAAFALASFSYPTLVVAAALGCAALVVVHFRQRAALIAVLAAGVAAIAIVLLVVRHFGGLAGVLSAIHYNRAFGVQGGGVEKLRKIGKQIAVSMPYVKPLRIAIGVLAVVAAVLPRRRWIAIALLIVALAAFDHPADEWRQTMLVVFYALVFLAVPLIVTADRKLLFCVWLPSIIGGAVAAWTSSNGLPNAAVGLLPALVVTVAVLGRGIVAVAFAILIASLHLSTWTYVYGDDTVKSLDATIAGGPFAGMRTTGEKRAFLKTVTADAQRFAAAGAKSCLFYDGFPAGYLLTSMRPITASVWIASHSALPNFDRQWYANYFRNRRPDVVFEMHKLPVRHNEERDFADYAIDPFRQFFWRRGDRLTLERRQYSVFTSCPACRAQWIEAETMAGVSRAPDYGVSALVGWGSYSADDSGGSAALTRKSGAVMRGTIAPFAPGDYDLGLSWYSYETASSNTITIALGDVSRTLRLGPGCEGGLHRIDNVRFHGVTSPGIEVRAGDIGQAYLIIDSVRIAGVPPASAGERDAHGPTTDCASAGDESRAPVLIEAESLAPVSHAADYGTAAITGWAAYSLPSYSGSSATLTRMVGATMHGTIPRFRPGSYAVTVTGYSYGPPDVNEIDVTIGNVTKRVKLGGAAGIVRVSDVHFHNVTSPRIEVRAVGIKQPYVIVDAIEIRPLAGSAD